MRGLTLLLIGLLSLRAECFTAGRSFVGLKTKVPSVAPPLMDLSSPNRPQMTVLNAVSSSDEQSSFPKENFLWGGVWVALVAFAAVLAPGSFGSTQDNAMLESIVANPTAPGLNELFYAVFNLFVLVSCNLACLAYPQASVKKDVVPVAPALVSSAFLGYFTFGPYMALRGETRDSVALSELNWVTRNVLENKVFNVLMLAFGAFCIVPAIAPAQADFAGLIQGFQDLIGSSKFASVATVDFALLNIVSASLLVKDYKLRNPDDADSAPLIAALTLLLPSIGAALYCLLRPNLSEE